MNKDIKVHLEQFDISEKYILNAKSIAIDTEAMGLNTNRDRLCAIQILIDEKTSHVIHFPEPRYDSPNLKKLLGNNSIEKIFHFARFDMLILYKYLGIMTENVVCTKILSKIARTYTERHGLKELCRERLKIDLNKGEQSSDWGGKTLTQSQVDYAIKDVLYLPQLYRNLKEMAERENRYHIAKELFKCLQPFTLAEYYLYDPSIALTH